VETVIATSLVYEACFDGTTWRRMAQPNPTSDLYMRLVHPGDIYADRLGNLYRVTECVLAVPTDDLPYLYPERFGPQP
jgi:hypothetical protein